MLRQTLMTIAQSQVLPDGRRVQILRRLGYQVGSEPSPGQASASTANPSRS